MQGWRLYIYIIFFSVHDQRVADCWLDRTNISSNENQVVKHYSAVILLLLTWSRVKGHHEHRNNLIFLFPPRDCAGFDGGSGEGAVSFLIRAWSISIPLGPRARAPSPAFNSCYTTSTSRARAPAVICAIFARSTAVRRLCGQESAAVRSRHGGGRFGPPDLLFPVEQRSSVRLLHHHRAFTADEGESGINVVSTVLMDLIGCLNGKHPSNSEIKHVCRFLASKYARSETENPDTTGRRHCFDEVTHFRSRDIFALYKVEKQTALKRI